MMLLHGATKQWASWSARCIRGLTKATMLLRGNPTVAHKEPTDQPHFQNRNDADNREAVR